MAKSPRQRKPKDSPVLTGEKQIADYLGISLETLRLWRLHGTMPIMRVGRLSLTTRGALEQWILENAGKQMLKEKKSEGD